MAGQVTDTTPLLRSKQPMLPGSGPFPPQGQYPNARFMATQYQMYNRGSGQEGNRIHHDGDLGKDPHSQFCALTGCPPTNAPAGFKYRMNEKTLYGRALAQVQSQNLTYQLTAALTNTLLLMQIVLGAALTGLGGSGVPPWVITLFGATNTVIAGLVAYLKSRGQPMRARMFRDDLERVVDEIENSEVMWLGIAKGVHGYADIDTDDEVTVRSEVARLTRLLDKAIRNNTANNPDLYSTTALTSEGAGGQNKGVGPYMTFPAVNLPADSSSIPNQPTTPAAKDADAAPATSAKTKKEEEAKKKKEEEDKAAAEKKKKEDESKAESSKKSNAATTTSTSDDKGKAPETLTSIAGKAQDTFATMGNSKLGSMFSQKSGDTDASPATSSSFSKKTTTTSSGGSDGKQTTTTTTTDSGGDGNKTNQTQTGSGRQPALEED